VIFESERVPKVFLSNLPVAVLGLMALLVVASKKKKKEMSKPLRAIGRKLCDAKMLIFVCYRMDYRAILVRHGKFVQSLQHSGFEQTQQEFTTLAQLQQGICALQAARGFVKTSMRLWECIGGGREARKNSKGIAIDEKSLMLFMVEVARASGMYRAFPTLVPRLLEVLFRKSFLGIPIGQVKKK
jgi:hypothetical protein